MPIATSRSRATALLGVVAALALLLLATPRPAHADAITLELVADLSFSPVVITHAGDGSGRLFIVDQEGVIRIWNGSEVLPTPFLDISANVLCCGEQGMLGLAFHPDYEQPGNGYFYVNYITSGPTSVIARYKVSGNPNVANPASALVMKSVGRPADNHNAGQLAFGNDGYLYFSMGDSGQGGDPLETAQDVQSLFGKIWRLDVDAPAPYIPPTNPLVGQPGADETWSMGFRNPWRFSFDRLTGDMFIADVGQEQREEVNFQAAGDTTFRNYGWDNMEGSACFEPSSGCTTAGMTLPIIEYTHAVGCSVTGGYRYRGPQPALYGKYIYGDFCTGQIWAATLNGSSWTSVLQTDAPFMISTFGEGDDGELYVADYSGTAILRIVASGLDSDGDGVTDPSDNCPPISNPGQQDGDNDQLGDPCEPLFGTVNGDQDSDNDGCFDGREARPETYSPGEGGDRDPADPWDFYDVTGSRTIDLQDTLSVLQYFGQNGTPGANLRDRLVTDPDKPWRTSEANNGVDLQDALINLKSFGSNCV
jgi:glucose/arabinose dehydrogenase